MPPTDRSFARQVDAACRRFEAAWRAGQAPRIEDFLGPAAGPNRAALLRALLAAEVRLRRSTGETVIARTYRERFPDDAAAVASVFPAPAPDPAETAGSPASARTGPYEPPTDAPAADPSVPDRIGRFAVTAVLGAGAFGRVYRATDPQLGRDVAIKVPLAAAVASPDDRERFLKEARAAAGLHHPNICPVHEVGEQDGRPYIVMGFVPGQTLAAVLKARKEPLSPKQAALIARKLALALDAAHKKGIIHRDLKPANVMFDKERRDVVVADFGLARGPRLGDAQATRSGVLMGTPAYMAPEQARGDTKAVGPASDQFALGVMLYEMLTGRRPFTGTVTEVLGKILHVEPDPPAKLRPDLDPALAAVCLTAMAKDPAARFASMRHLADALAPFASNVPTTRPAAAATASAETAREATETQRIADVFAFAEEPAAESRTVRRLARRTPAWPVAGGGLLAVLVLVVLGGVLFLPRSDRGKGTTEQAMGPTPPAAGATTAGTVPPPIPKVGPEKDATPPGPVPPPAATPAAGFTPLFNGKDTQGWHASAGGRADWRVEGDVLTGTGLPGYLITDRADFEDFRLRVEARIEAGADSGVGLRAQDDRVSLAYEAQIGAGLPGLGHTGSFVLFDGRGAPILAPAPRAVPPGRWFTMEVLARGHHFTIWVDGEPTADYEDADRHFARGSIALQKIGPGGSVSFRRVEVRELPRPAGAPAPAEPGFVPLFNGKDLAGWKAVGGPKWTWADGRLRGAPGAGGAPGYLVTEAEYEDFELELQYRLGPAAGSGIFLRCVPNGVPTGAGQVEVQVIDDDGFPKTPEIARTGSVYNVFPRTAVPPVRRGDWNAVRVRLVRRHIEVWVNGVQTVNASLDAAGDKRATVPGLTRQAGGIGLQQNQKSDVEFREVRIKDLSRPGGAGFVPLFNGKDLAGWKAHPDAKAKWTVEDGYLTASGPAGHLFTDRDDYEDVVFRVEARINDHGNSGQYVRAAFGPGFPRGYEVQINATHRDPIKTGSLYPTFDPALTAAQKDRLTVKEAAHKPGEWFTQEVTAVGNHITIKVNGRTTVDFVDEKDTFRKGHLALQHHDPGTKVQFRKVEVRELSR